MTRSPNISRLGRFQPPIRRVLAVDAGSRGIRLLLAQSDFGQLRIIKQEAIDLQREGLVSDEETQAHLQSLLDSWGRPPVALVLPEHLSTSQTVDLPAVPETEVDKLIHEETVKLRGVSETAVVYDFVRTGEESKNRRQFWVTVCQEGEIRERLARLGLQDQDICEVTTTANALISAYRKAAPRVNRSILVHLGAQNTVVVILADGRAAFAASYQMGGGFFTRSLARQTNVSETAAEAAKCSANLFTGPKTDREFIAVVDGWVAELKRQLNDWFGGHPEMAAEVGSFRLVATGSAFSQPGLLDHLKQEAGLNLHRWPSTSSGQPKVLPGFEIAYGAALQALGHGSQPVSLLPEDYQRRWKKRLLQQRLETASFVLAAVCVLLLAAGTWHALNLTDIKSRLLSKTTSAQASFNMNESLTTELVTEYETLRPLFAAEQNSRDTLAMLALLQNSRSNRSFWYVLIADQQSYFNPPPSMRPPPLVTVERPPNGLGSNPASTNALSAAKPGYIAELSMTNEGEAARAVLSEIVNLLKQEKLFAKVDSLSDDLRRNIAEPKVLLPNRHFALSLDFANTEFRNPVRPKATGFRRSSRPVWDWETQPQEQPAPKVKR